MSEELEELIAKFMHKQWAHWMKYMFEKAITNDDCSETLTPTERTGIQKYNFNTELYNRWKTQADTPYQFLTETEKDSDREWAIKLIEKIDEWRNE